MNRLPLEKRKLILHLLVEGNSVRGTARIADVSKDTVLKLIVDVGERCAAYQHIAFMNLPCTVIEVDEIWSFIQVKKKRLHAKSPPNAGDIWTWVATCADTRLVPCWYVGGRNLTAARAFMNDLAPRFQHRINLKLSTAPNVKPTEVYAFFAGTIDTQAAQRIMHGIDLSTQSGVKTFHLLMQSTGGFVSDGVCLYNFFRALPIDLAIYNCGSIASAATTAYLGAKIRKTSAFATFMIHRTHVSPVAANTSTLEALTHSIGLDDARLDAIHKSQLRLSKEKWDIHNVRDLWFSAKEAVDCGIASEIGEFSPPVGTSIYSL